LFHFVTTLLGLEGVAPTKDFMSILVVESDTSCSKFNV